MSNTFYRTFQKLSVLLGGAFLIFQAFRVLKNIQPKETRVIARVITQSRWSSLTLYVTAQARHETFDYKSELSVAFNNLFGMKNAFIRPQLGVSIPKSDFRKFSSHEESVRDFLLYLEFVDFPETVRDVEEYVYELKKRSYFEEPYTTYLGGISRYV